MTERGNYKQRKYYSEEFVQRVKEAKADFRKAEMKAPHGFWELFFKRAGYPCPDRPSDEANYIANRESQLKKVKIKRREAMKELLDKYFPEANGVDLDK